MSDPTGERASRLLFIGADEATLIAAHDLGYDAVVVVSEADRDFGLVEIPDRFTTVVVPDTGSIENLMTAVRRSSCGDRPFEAVLSSDELAIVAAAVLAQHLGVRGPDLDAVLTSRDKAEQKRRLAAAGLHRRGFGVIEDLRSAVDLPAVGSGEHGWVVKPLHGCATEVTVHVRPGEPWHPLRQRLLSDELSPATFIVEEYVPGVEWQIDGIIHGSQVVFASLGRYLRPCIESVSEGRPVQTFRPGADDPMHERAVDFAQRCLAALGSTDGAFHLEFFVNGDELVFGECAMRRGAASIQEEVWLKWGVDMARAALLSSLGRDPEIVVEESPHAVASTDLPCAPGVIIELPDLAELRSLPCVAKAWFEVPAGMLMPEPVNTVYRLGSVVVEGRHDTELAERMDDVVDWVRERTFVTTSRTPPVLLRQRAHEVRAREAAPRE